MLLQLQKTAPPPYDDYFRKGDWQDVFIYDSTNESAAEAAKPYPVRQQLDYFNGTMVVHCHILHHEDNGTGLWTCFHQGWGDVCTLVATNRHVCGVLACRDDY